jgi:WNK lysine deficient protein kinase
MNENFTFAVKKIKFNTKYEKEILKELEIHSLISRINHKNIVRFEEYWIENNDIKKSGVKTSTLFFRMELCDKTLDQFLEKFHTNSKFNGTLFKYYISSAIFVEILEGVNYLHKNEPQIIHRDLRPDNILMNLDENSNVSVKIADFGLVTIHKYAEQLHEGDRGHIRYAAPEVLDGEIYDTKADIYSLGKVLKDIFGIDFDDFE